MKDLLLDFLLFLVIVAIIAAVIMAGAEIKNAPVEPKVYATRLAYADNLFANLRREFIWREIQKGIESSGYAREIDPSIVFAFKYYASAEKLCFLKLSCPEGIFGMSKETWDIVLNGYSLDVSKYKDSSIKDSAEILARYLAGYNSLEKNPSLEEFVEQMENFYCPFNIYWSEKNWKEIYALSEYLPYLE